ncbi:hypothetical protein ACFRCI_23445 [Streptomyces sp. NPDC056638]|uniref:hypothetical protein n=1 Tax=Streptomyces sp. NPDC056638 TaxID=3345887 RepID=UPI003684D75C
MNDDLRTRIAEALCENSGLSWHTAWTMHRDGFLDDADAVLRVRDVEVQRLEQERDAAKAAADAWKELAERNDVTSSPLRAELRRAERERDRAQREGGAWRDEGERLREELAARTDSADVDDLKNTIVSQAREIARLKGESA